MSELAPIQSNVRGAFRRGWWVVLLAAVLAAAATFFASPVVSSNLAYGVINTRDVATAPNERADLISDLQTATNLSSVLGGPAQTAGLTVGEVRSGLSLSRLGNSSLMEISFTSALPTERAQTLISDVLDAATGFLSDAGDETRGRTAQITELEAQIAASEDEVDTLLQDNSGIPPTLTYDNLQRTLTQLTAAPDTDNQRLNFVRDRIREFYPQSQAFEEAETQIRVATNRLQSLQQADANDAARQFELRLRNDLGVTFQPDVASRLGYLAVVRRVGAAAVGGGLLGAIVVLLLAAARPTQRRR